MHIVNTGAGYDYPQWFSELSELLATYNPG